MHLAPPVQQHRCDGDDECESREVELHRQRQEERHEQHRTAPRPLEQDEQAPEQADRHHRHEILCPELAAVEHRPRRRRKQCRRRQRRQRAEPPPQHDVREADRHHGREPDGGGRRPRVVPHEEGKGDEVDEERRVLRTGTRREADRSEVAVDDVAPDPHRQRLVGLELHQPQLAQPQPPGEHEDHAEAAELEPAAVPHPGVDPIPRREAAPWLVAPRCLRGRAPGAQAPRPVGSPSSTGRPARGAHDPARSAPPPAETLRGASRARRARRRPLAPRSRRTDRDERPRPRGRPPLVVPCRAILAHALGCLSPGERATTSGGGIATSCAR